MAAKTHGEGAARYIDNKKELELYTVRVYEISDSYGRMPVNVLIVSKNATPI